MEAVYANSFRAGYNAFEILLDFGKVSAETGRPKLQSRIIMTPAIAQAVLDTLQESLDQYRLGYGAIPGGGEE